MLLRSLLYTASWAARCALCAATCCCSLPYPALTAVYACPASPPALTPQVKLMALIVTSFPLHLGVLSGNYEKAAQHAEGG